MPRDRGVWIVLLLGALLSLGGCSKKQEVGAPPLAGQKAKSGALLAYEHSLGIRLPAEAIAGRVATLQQACETARFGACNVLRVEQTAHDALLAVRIVPEGVEPMAALASQGGKVGLRQTTAVDLADAVGDIRRQRELLERQAQHLAELAARKDLAVADLIALSHEQAAVENQLQAMQAVATGQQRRLDTNRLELRFDDGTAGSHRARLFDDGLAGLLDQASEGVSDALGLLGYGLPFLILAFPLAMLWRWLWRRFTRREAIRP